MIEEGRKAYRLVAHGGESKNVARTHRLVTPCQWLDGQAGECVGRHARRARRLYTVVA